jgi:hypothetical protein
MDMNTNTMSWAEQREAAEQHAAGMTVVEWGTLEELEHIKLVLARACGMPEPVLYDDPSPDVYSKDEAPLNKVIDIQERMSKGMIMIQECNKKLEYFNSGHRVPYDVYMAWVDRRRALWSHWWMLKHQCDALAKDAPTVWPEYFNLCSEEINPYHTTSDPEDIDNQVALYDKGETVRVYRDTHLAEEAECV